MQTLEEKVRWADREDKNKDPLEFFRENYGNGTRRAELAQQDFALYRILLRKELLDIAIPSRFGADLLAFYREHYSGMTRGQLYKENRSLYQRLLYAGLLEEVPTAIRVGIGIDPLAFYREHYPGMPRGQLRNEDPSLYGILLHAGLLKEVPLKQ